MLSAPIAAQSALGALEQDYLMMALFVRIQHQQCDAAHTLIKALITAGEVSPDLLFAKAVVENALGAHDDALLTVSQLENIAPATMSATPKQVRRARMRSYIKARASFALSGDLDAEAKTALDFYLRHGRQKKRKRPTK